MSAMHGQCLLQDSRPCCTIAYTETDLVVILVLHFTSLSTFWRQQNKALQSPPWVMQNPSQILGCCSIAKFPRRTLCALPSSLFFFFNFSGGWLVWVCCLFEFPLRQSPPSPQKCSWCANAVSKPQERNIFSQLPGSTCESAAVRGRRGLFVHLAVVGACCCQKPSQTALTNPGCWCSPSTQSFF